MLKDAFPLPLTHMLYHYLFINAFSPTLECNVIKYHDNYPILKLSLTSSLTPDIFCCLACTIKLQSDIIQCAWKRGFLLCKKCGMLLHQI